MEINFRHAEIVDVKKLVEVESKCFTYNKLTSTQFIRLIKKGHIDLLIAEQIQFSSKEIKIVGYGLLFYRKNSARARLYSLAVVPEWSGRGIGKKLILALEKLALESKKIEISLEVKESNKQALNLYSKNAYNIVEKIENYYEDGASAFRLCKTLVK